MRATHGLLTRSARGARILAISSILAASLALGGGPASAAVDSSNSVVDSTGRAVEAVQADTRIDFVPPLDGNPLSREWFHDGTAAYKVTGPDAENWRGRVTIGYQVGYPATVGGRIRFEYSTPGLGVELGGSNGGLLKIDSLIPKAGVELDVGFGPGIQTFECAAGDISGPEGFIRLAGFHGSVTGVLGATNIRPFVRIVSAGGDTVITYGKPWTI
ncbi:MspA family porin [Nocardia bovistercoris]|uniref:MspA family porin n=1 Tax=Nocardia bovistercoris TaxID=2785916 RepID=A0A931I7Q1_9NOCA|nr:MspA family porin [Nocardia bovistercoris]MBH0776399.1 MspA family porin [Nocardia bovistercoris]